MLGFLEEVKILIECLKKKKEPESENITIKLLQAGKDHRVKVIDKLLNKICKQEQLLSEWGKVIMVPVYRKGNKSEYKNHRGISLSVGRKRHCRGE